MHAINIQNIFKKYKLYNSPVGRLKEALWRGRKRYHSDFWALRNISFSIEKSTTFGIIGRNGSGKSTLLQLIAGILKPSEGNIEINGRISALLELGSGFDPEFTGRENVYMNGAILGIDKSEIDNRFSEIERFADIDEFIDQPVKLYSSGMYVRLAFATAVNVDPDILLVDEALSVGDVVFQHRCMRKIREIQELGKTIIFVSHDIGAVQKLCTNALLLDKGEMISIGTPEDVIKDYNKLVWNAEDINNDSENVEENKIDSISMEMFDMVKNCDSRFGNRNGEIIATALTDESGRKIESVCSNMKVCFSIVIRCNEDIDMPLAGFILKDLLGNELIKTNTDAEHFFLKKSNKNETMVITFTLVMPNFKAGSYSFSAGIGNGTIDSHTAYDWIDNLRVFTMEGGANGYGLINTSVKVNRKMLM